VRRPLIPHALRITIDRFSVVSDFELRISDFDNGVLSACVR
jgi:hypothetical protein